MNGLGFGILLGIPFILWLTMAPAKSFEDFSCLAEATAFEAGGESALGQKRVIETIYARLHDPNFPRNSEDNTLCAVVHDIKIMNGTCVAQFSYYCDGRSDDWWNDERFTRVRGQILWIVAMAFLLDHDGVDENGKAHCFYHNTSVEPEWSKNPDGFRVPPEEVDPVLVGNHRFYECDDLY